MKNCYRITFVIAVLAVLGFSTSCSSVEPVTEHPTDELPLIMPEEVVLTFDPAALDREVEVMVEEVGEGDALGQRTTLTPSSLEYEVDLGGANQVGAISMTVPLNTAGKVSAPSSSDRVYMVWAEPEGGIPSAVGTVVDNGLATFPLIGPGSYLVYSIPSHESLLEMFGKFEPLAVPSYKQRTPGWCSPTALTNLAQYHEGAWPAGGLGSLWGETSNYYLAGLARQPHGIGKHFHKLLDAAGYAAPASVRESFSDGNVEVIIWNWTAITKDGCENPVYAEKLFNFFQAYVESYLWGFLSDPRPVAWGSGQQDHSRTITGSNGIDFFFNDPGSGSLNDTRSWQDYRDYVMDSLDDDFEIIDTVVFHSPPRSESERKGVIWLYPVDDQGFPGSVAMVSGETGEYVTHWHWDGSGGHTRGYYYEDLTGRSKPVMTIGAKFKAYHYDDVIEIGYGVRNITDQTQGYQMDVTLVSDDHGIYTTIHETDVSVGPAGKVDVIPADQFRLAILPPGIYDLAFVLKQSGIVQDVKWVIISVGESDQDFYDFQGITGTKVHCREGPSIDYDSLRILDEGTKVDILGVNPERTWGKFELDEDGNLTQCWIAISIVDQAGEDEAPVIETPPPPNNRGDDEEDQADLSCSDYDNPNQCNADSGCTWKLKNDGTGYCTED